MLRKLGFKKIGKKGDGWIPGDQTKLKADVKKTFGKVKSFAKDYKSGNQGWVPGNQTKFKASVKETFGKVKSFTKDYVSGKQGYLPGNQTRLKKRLTSAGGAYTDWKKGKSGYLPGDQSKLKEMIAGVFKKKKKKNIKKVELKPKKRTLMV